MLNSSQIFAGRLGRERQLPFEESKDFNRCARPINSDHEDYGYPGLVPEFLFAIGLRHCCLV